MRSHKFLITLIILLNILVVIEPVLGHSGRTDSAGGHRDNQNASGLGYYHYHHGYGPHLHPNGICPYANKSSNTTTGAPDDDSNFFVYGIGGTIAFFVLRLLTNKMKSNVTSNEKVNLKDNIFKENPVIIKALDETKSDIDILTCPKCNSKMVLRHGKYGTFYGCSRYPKCTGTRNCKSFIKK